MQSSYPLEKERRTTKPTMKVANHHMPIAANTWISLVERIQTWSTEHNDTNVIYSTTLRRILKHPRPSTLKARNQQYSRRICIRVCARECQQRSGWIHVIDILCPSTDTRDIMRRVLDIHDAGNSNSSRRGRTWRTHLVR